MDIHLHNTKTRKKELLTPVTPGRVGMYVCGPTVYDRAHIGNARPVIVFDVLYRLLRHAYGAENVTYVRNFTDVDDKIIARAEETGREIGDITAETTAWYLEDMAAVGALEPTKMPRATDWIGAMVEMIEGLIGSDHAYAAEGHVLFRVRSYEAYGALSGRSVDDMIAGARVEVAPYKEDPMDFVLWKPAKAGEPGWDSPWGKGRPGWHIECSAMADALLGESFDIHGGGNDLMFPHHENEIAQSRCAHPEGEFARIWMHNEMLQVEGKKMSKSLGNFFTVRDLLDQGVPGEVIRFVFLGTHYRKPMDWTEKKRQEAEKKLDRLLRALSISIELVCPPSHEFADLPKGMQIGLEDDLNTHAALFSLEQQAELVEGLASGDIVSGEPHQGDATREAAVAFATGLDVLGLYELLIARKQRRLAETSSLDEVHLAFVAHYELAKQNKDFSVVDELKAKLLDAGVEVRIRQGGVDLIPGSNFDPTKLDGCK
ncbi:cysteine--tRNA ligase [Vannielia litorea]|uniref:cysteine--tRNA ligase n=1 Tax=Vannielia litorea TaxID=1217970 RepID=UPI001C949BFD|nr:cysteine--tRNA ligase [Vannielia litorea]MBY6152991.1 cysteine--tRNA ligase [Vannielia litorea]